MAEQAPKPDAGTIVMAAILAGALIIAVLGTLLPDLIGLTGAPAIIMQLAFYAVAIVDVAIAFWLRARLRKAQPRGGGTVQRQ